MIAVYNKLVRDRIPEIIESKGTNVSYSILSEDEYKEALKGKLVEELHEFLEAETEEEMIEELADFMTVLSTIIDNTSGINGAKIEERALSKIAERGAFNKRYFLESVEE